MNLRTKTRNQNQNQDNVLRSVLTELEFIKSQLAKLLLLIPKESLEDYTNAKQIKKDFVDALNNFPPV